MATSLYEPHRDFIDAQLRLKRNAMAIFQGLVDMHGFAGQYHSVRPSAPWHRAPPRAATEDFLSPGHDPLNQPFEAMHFGRKSGAVRLGR